VKFGTHFTLYALAMAMKHVTYRYYYIQQLDSKLKLKMMYVKFAAQLIFANLWATQLLTE